MDLRDRAARLDPDLDFSTGEGRPYSEPARVRAAGRIVWSDALQGWIVSTYEDVRALFADAEGFTAAGSALAENFGAEAMLVTNLPRHRDMRNVWAAAFSPAAMIAREAEIQAIADRVLAPFVASLGAGAAADIVPVFEAMTTSVNSLLLGVTPQEGLQLHRWGDVSRDVGGDLRRESKAATTRFLEAALADRADGSRAAAKPRDLVALMAAALARGEVTHTEAVDNLINAGMGSAETTIRWMGNILVALARRPDVDGAVRADRSLLPNAINEVMRLESVVQFNIRIARFDGAEIGGRAFKLGEHVHAYVGAANRDPAVYDRPDEFDLKRDAQLHLGFGFGIHRCIGQHVARHEVLAFLGRLFDILPPLAVVEVDYGASWTVWGPRRLVMQLA